MSPSKPTSRTVVQGLEFFQSFGFWVLFRDLGLRAFSRDSVGFTGLLRGLGHKHGAQSGLLQSPRADGGLIFKAYRF